MHMAKPLRHTKSGTKEVQRLLCHHLDQALKALQGSQPLSDAAVHSARKQLKKARADLRLLRKALGPQRYTYENMALRDVARPLTAVRDARVLMDTLETLVEHGDAQMHVLDLDRVRLALRDAYGEVRQRVLHEGNTLALLEAPLRAAGARAKHWSLGRRGWSVLGAGVQRVYRNGRKAFTVAQEGPSPEHFHAWRKQAKYLWHQLQVLQPIQLGQLTALADQAHALADALGDDHDLAVLAHKCLHDADRFPERATMATLADLIARRRAHLQEQAMTLGHQLYEAKPRLFVDRLRAYWRAWHGKAAQVAPSGSA
jgi:CHAD domain-containing protein